MAELTFDGGLNEQDDAQVDSKECTAGYNFELGLGNTHFKPRKPFDKLGTSTNAASINGFIQLVKNDASETTLVQSGDTVYTWNGTTGFTSKGTVTSTSKLRGTTWTLGGYTVITDIMKLTQVKKWDGTTFGNLTTGLGATLYAKYGIVYLGRVWLLNVKAGTDTPHLLVASAFENPESYDTSLRAKDSSFTTGNEAFYMVTPNLLPINGVALFYNTLIISTESGELFKLTGTTSTDFAFTPFYSGSAAIGTETMTNIGNDVVYIRNGGRIDKLLSVQNYGDVQTDDLSRWIPTTIQGITDSITVYDQDRQKVYFFAGSNKLLVYFKNMDGTNLSPWSVYKTSHASSFETNSAIYMKAPGSQTKYVFFGDDSGNIYRMEGTSDGDNGDTDISTYRRSKYIEMFEDSPNIFRGRVEYKRIADLDLIMDFEWADDYSTARCTVPLEGPPVGDDANYFGGSSYWGGAFYWNSGFFYADRVSTKGFSPVGRGPGFHLMLTVTGKQSFDILRLRDAETQAQPSS